MAVSQIGKADLGDVKEFIGLSVDVKPVANESDGVSYRIGSGSTFYEKDTGDSYIYDENDVNPVTSNHWWEVV
jgi:hypothetical protein